MKGYYLLLTYVTLILTLRKEIKFKISEIKFIYSTYFTKVQATQPFSDVYSGSGFRNQSLMFWKVVGLM